MKKIEVNPGDRFGMLTIIEEVEKKHNQRRFKCKCDCGNETEVYLHNVNRGVTSSCGCRMGNRFKEVDVNIGDKYNALTIISEPYKNNKHQKIVKCKCECGNELEVNLYTLRFGGVKRCRECNKNLHKKFVIHPGDKFGKLTVIEEDRSTLDSSGLPRLKWKCKCECGVEISISNYNLPYHSSCGCDKRKVPVHPGDKYGKLTVIEEIVYPDGTRNIECLCDCGEYTEVKYSRLIINKGGCSSCNPERHSYPDINIGSTYGRLTVIDIPEAQQGRKKALCKCECGNTKLIDFRTLKSAKEYTGCGCGQGKLNRSATRHRNIKINPGDRFNSLTVIEEIEKKNNNRMVKCKCDCGNETIVTVYNLTSGRIRSCGCSKKKITINPGDKYGKLTVIEEIEKKSGRRMVKCKCDCGNETTVFISNLVNGNIKSCGCLRNK